MSIVSVIIAILLLGLLIFAHELGHFCAARATGIEVMEFSMGFGPKILGWQGKSGTQFSLRCIPLGGYCAFYGEDDAEGKHVDDPRAYYRQSVWKRMLSVIMGPMMNFILPFVVLILYFLIGGVVDTPSYVTPYVASVNADSPAEAAGLQVGDVITHVDGAQVLDGTRTTLTAALNHPGPLTLTVRRGEESFETTVSPAMDASEGRYLIGILVDSLEKTRLHVGLGESISLSWRTCVYAGQAILDALKGLVTRGEGFENLGGPVAAISEVSQQVSVNGFDAFINALVIISINLGIMNLLPIPGLDGSRFLFMLVEAIRRKPVPREKEALVHLVGMALLFALMIFFLFRDVWRLF